MADYVRSDTLQVIGIKKVFPGITAVNFDESDVLEFLPGEIHALVGENGAGKSTLVSIIAGIQRATEGTMVLAGQPFLPNNVPEARGKGVEIVLQELGLVRKMTVADNLFLGREKIYTLHGFLNPLMRRKFAQDSLARVDSNIPVMASTGTLDLEQQKFIELARALSFDPRVLIIDEMTASLSDNGVNRLFQLLFQLREAGKIILYISHYLEEIFKLCDRITVMKDGRLVKTLRREETNEDEVSTLMVGRTTKSSMYHQELKVKNRNETLLTVENLSYGNFFNNINLVLQSGEILGIGGLVGCGNEELAQALFGAIRINSGKIILQNKPVILIGPRNAIHQNVGYVPKDRDNEGLMLRASLRDNIILSSLPWFTMGGFIQHKRISDVALRLIKLLNIACRGMRDVPMQLSGGNRQKVVLSKWLVRENKILIMNNPTRGIDVGAKFEVYKLIRQMAEKGVGIVLISHELPELLGMCDRILIMKHGKVVFETENNNNTTEELLISHMI